MWRHYVYVHRRSDSGAVFYVGKGTVRARLLAQVCERANDHSNRNLHWRRTVAKHGLLVEVVASFRDDADAQAFERSLIAEYGRRTLVNLTEGGDGCAGIVPSASTRAKLSTAAQRPRSEAWVASIRRARAGGGNGGVVKHGDRLPAEWRNSMAYAKRGDRNPMFGVTGGAHPRARAVLDAASGRRYETVRAAAEATGIKMKSLHNMLSGHRPNRTTLRFA